MKHLIDSLPHGIGKRPQTEMDFYHICEVENIEIIWSDTKFSFYCSCSLGAFITLPKRLKGVELLFHSFHELAHHFISAGRPVAVEWFGMPHDRDEKEANAIALIAILPDIRRLPDLLDQSPKRFARWIYAERQRLRFFYQL